MGLWGRQSGVVVVGRVRGGVWLWSVVEVGSMGWDRDLEREGVVLAVAVKAGKAGPARCSGRPYLLHDM